jgi:hypothetical protein
MKISLPKYAKLRGITHQAAYEAVRNGWQMPGVEKVVKVGNRYVVHITSLEAIHPAPALQ